MILDHSTIFIDYDGESAINGVDCECGDWVMANYSEFSECLRCHRKYKIETVVYQLEPYEDEADNDGQD